ncbi:MAG: Type II and III secretion system protein [Limisphaerales bacterium]|nr:MAG: Type II and III secretion system protein [Limisphaerales bacterium]KAG0508502.1 MAG: Type II and III secretion system protein [Limisphaerales bacterium]TXT48928.1 MAG: Type II and III secretion system protein [Limisphaerales bacterium]
MKQRLLVFSALCLLAIPARPAPAGPDPVAIAEEEALRRQERRLVLDANLLKAKQLQREKDFANAAKLYEEAIGHARLLGGVEAVEKQYRDALAGLTHCRIQLAIALQEKYEFREAAAEADKIFPFDPRSSAAEEFKRFNDRVESAHKGRLPSQQAVTKRAELIEGRSKIMGLVRDGRLYYEVGEYKVAKEKLEEAIALDPMNDAAFFYLRLIMESQFERESRLRENTYSKRVVEVSSKWNEGTRKLPSPNPYYKTNSEVPLLTHSSKGAQMINRKLEEIVFPEISYDALPLPEVVKMLDTDAKKNDPEPDPKKKGVNFLINNVVTDYISLNATGPGGAGGAAAAAPAQQLLDPMGNPIAAAPVGAQKPDLDTALIKVASVLRNLTLRQVLDVICKTAEVKLPDGRTSGLKYSIEEYAIVFSPKLPEQASLFPRMFKVNPDTFVQGLQSVVANPIQAVFSSGGGAGGQGGGGQGGGGGGQQGGLGGAGGQGGQQQSGAGFSIAGVSVAGQSQGGGGGGGGGGAQGQGGIAGVTSTNLTSALNIQVREYFQAAGVVNLGVTNGPDATQVFFNDRNGLLLVRASLQDLDIIQQAIELLNAIPPQVLVESKFAEINQNDNKSLGFDWFWGNTIVGPTAVQGGTAPTLTGRPSAANPLGLFPLAGGAPIPATSSDANLTSGVLSRNSAPALATITGILTDPQFRVVIRALEQRDGTDVLSAPKVITVSGRQAQIQVTDIQTIITGITPGQTAAGGGGAAAGGAAGGAAIGAQLQPSVQALPTGPVLDVLPTVAADGYTINMALIPSITQFIGYDAVPPEFAGAIQAQSVGAGTVGVPLTAQVPLPRTRVRQVVTQCVVWDAQTVMLGGLISEDVQNTKDKVPVLGDLPLVGRLFRSETKTNRKKNLVIFVTPTIIDPAGNRVHTDDEMPFAAPPQVGLVR